MSDIDKALKNIIRAWEVLPCGHYGPREVERWLRENMKPAIDAGRAALLLQDRGTQILLLENEGGVGFST